MSHIWSAILVAVPTTLLTTLLCSSNAHSEDYVDSALRSFLGNHSNAAGFDLDKSRPQPVPPDFKADVLKSLPKEGRLTKLNEPQRQKLDSLGIVLQVHQRQSVYDFVVFESTPKPFAFIGLHRRAV